MSALEKIERWQQQVEAFVRDQHINATIDKGISDILIIKHTACYNYTMIFFLVESKHFFKEST